MLTRFVEAKLFVYAARSAAYRRQMPHSKAVIRLHNWLNLLQKLSVTVVSSSVKFVRKAARLLQTVPAVHARRKRGFFIAGARLVMSATFNEFQPVAQRDAAGRDDHDAVAKGTAIAGSSSRTNPVLALHARHC